MVTVTPSRELLFWVAILAGLVVIVVMLGHILLPFVAGWFIAYLFTPVVRRLEAIGLGHAVAVVLVTLFFVLAIVAIVLLILPAFVNQLIDLIRRAPGWLAELETLLTDEEGNRRIAEILGIDVGELHTAVEDLVQQGATFAVTVVNDVWTGGRTLVSLFALVVVTPVIAFYLLLDWDRMTAALKRAVPRAHTRTVHRLLSDMDRHVSGFVHGQFVVGLLLGLYYATTLLLVGLDRALLIGLVAGLLSFIPYLGSTTCFLLAVGVALGQFWPDWAMIAVVVGIVLFGQFMEGNVLQPRLVGNRTGLHPVLLMFALFAFGALFGFAGLIVAVPAAAALAVLVRYGYERYEASPYYREPHGHPPPPETATEPEPAVEPAAERRDEGAGHV